MFGLFKKKEKEKEAEKETEREAAKGLPRPEESAQLRAFSSQFLPRELTVQAVTGATEFNGSKAGNKELWIASTSLTAWKEENSDEIHRGNFSLTTLGDDQLLEILRERAPWDSVIRFRGRVSEDGTYLLLLNLPEPDSDPQLKAILREQKEPITFDEEGLGTFFLNRQTDWFETDVDWLGTAITLVFNREENREDCVAHAKALLADVERWDSQVRAYAAGEFHALANDWAEGIEGEESEPVTREEFMERLGLDSIEIRADGSLEFWFNDGEMLYGHTIHISVDLENGPVEASMEG